MEINKDNKIKNISGKKAKELILNMLESLNRNLSIQMEITKDYSIGYPNQQPQFKMDFRLNFPNIDNKSWLIKSTNSIRERIYGTEFFAQNMREIDSDISNIFVVVPDSITEKELKNKENYSKKIKSGEYTSFLTDVLTVNELRDEIISHFSKEMSQGVKSNILGVDAEEEISRLLEDENNRQLWNDYDKNNSIIKSSTFKFYKEIISESCLEIGKDIIISVASTTDIPKIKNNGYPKSDVSFTVKTDNKEITRNVSVKNSFAKTVTIHEGKGSSIS